MVLFKLRISPLEVHGFEEGMFYGAMSVMAWFVSGWVMLVMILLVAAPLAGVRLQMTWLMRSDDMSLVALEGAFTFNPHLETTITFRFTTNSILLISLQ